MAPYKKEKAVLPQSSNYRHFDVRLPRFQNSETSSLPFCFDVAAKQTRTDLPWGVVGQGQKALPRSSRPKELRNG